MFFRSSMAKRVIELESEVERLNGLIKQKDGIIEKLNKTCTTVEENKNAILELYQRAAARSAQLSEENAMLLQVIQTPHTQEKSELQTVLTNLLAQSNAA